MDKPDEEPQSEKMLEMSEKKAENEFIKTLEADDTIINMSEPGVIRNLIVVGIAFMLQFSAFDSFASLQSSLNEDRGLGASSLASLYMTMLMSSLLLTPVAMSKFSSKWIMMVSMSTYLIYIMTGFYPTWYTLMPASIIIGIGASHHWLALQSFIADISKQYASLTGTKKQDSLNLFLGIFYAFMYASYIWGNLMSSFIFRRAENSTTIRDDETSCGPQYCPYLELNSSTILQPPEQKVFTYTGMCVGIMLLAITLILFGLTNISTVSTLRDVKSLVQQVARQICFSTTQHLLIFPTLLSGLNQGFLVIDFSQAYISCQYGVKNVGFVMIVCGVSLSTFSVIAGKLHQYTGHLALYCFGCTVMLTLYVTLLLWRPNVSEQYIIYILAAMFGISRYVSEPLIAALYSLYFMKNRDVALSIFIVLNSAGNAISMGYSNWLCTRNKLYILLSVLVLSLISIIVQHVRHKRKTDLMKNQCQ